MSVQEFSYDSIFSKLAHNAVLISILYAVYCVYGIYTDAPIVIEICFTFFVYAVLFASVRHEVVASNKLCVKCIKEVPYNAAVMATTSHKKWLQLCHWFSTNNFVFSFLLLIVVSNLLAIHVNVWFSLLPSLVIASCPISIVYHRRLRPWCPFCRRWDDGGAPEVVPSPDPAGTKQA